MLLFVWGVCDVLGVLVVQFTFVILHPPHPPLLSAVTVPLDKVLVLRNPLLVSSVPVVMLHPKYQW
jgi:hypothetical protein